MRGPASLESFEGKCCHPVSLYPQANARAGKGFDESLHAPHISANAMSSGCSLIRSQTKGKDGCISIWFASSKLQGGLE